MALLAMWIFGGAALTWFELSEAKFGWYFPIPV